MIVDLKVNHGISLLPSGRCIHDKSLNSDTQYLLLFFSSKRHIKNNGREFDQLLDEFNKRESTGCSKLLIDYDIYPTDRLHELANLTASHAYLYQGKLSSDRLKQPEMSSESEKKGHSPDRSVICVLINEADGNALDSNHKGRVYSLKPNGGSYQKWIVTEHDDGKLELTNFETGLLLDSNFIGDVFTRARNGGDNQKWRRVGKNLQNVATGQYMFPSIGLVCTWPILVTNEDNVKWSFKPIDESQPNWAVTKQYKKGRSRRMSKQALSSTQTSPLS